MVEPGSRVRVEWKGITEEGIIMPRHAFSASDVQVVKLDSGYNVGLRDAQIEVLSGPKERPTPEDDGALGTGKPPVAILGTGGTIASFVEYRTGAVHPATTPQELVAAVPELGLIAEPRPKVIMQVFSEDMTPQAWNDLLDHVLQAFEDGARGVVIAHGTDTLHYTAAALSYALRDLPGPVVLVGAQRSSDRPSSDAAGNLTAAVRTAAEADLGEVVVCMQEHLSDDAWALHRGSRARKMHTSRRDAFQSLDVPPIGHVDTNGVSLEEHARPADRDATPRRVGGFTDALGMVWAHPGISAGAVRAAAEKGLVIAGTGLGHVPEDLVKVLRELCDEGVLVGMTSQCLQGRVNLNVYERGRQLRLAGVVPLGDMTPEAAYAKMSWALASTDDIAQARERLLEDVAGELRETTGFHYLNTGHGGDAE